MPMKKPMGDSSFLMILGLRIYEKTTKGSVPLVVLIILERLEFTYALTLYEKETIINYNEAESFANIYTHNVALRNKLLKLSQIEADLRMIRLGADMIEVEVPKKWIRVNPPRKLSEQTRLELKERMLALRESQGQNTEKGGKSE